MSEFSAVRIESLLERDVRFFEDCESTQVEARQWADEGAPPGGLVVADAQHGGRGRLGRSWHSESGKNLAFSLILRPPLRIEEAPLLCLAAGVGVAEALDLAIKWPNDLLDGEGRKVAGILAEMETSHGRLKHAVIGIGVNVNQTDFPPEIPNPGSLSLLRGPQDRALILEKCVFSVEKWCAELVSARDRVLKRWKHRFAHQGAIVRVGETEGVAEGIRDDGALLLRKESGQVVPILAGDVEMVRQSERERSS